MEETLLGQLAEEYGCKQIDLFRDMLDLNGFDKFAACRNMDDLRALSTRLSPVGKMLDKNTGIYDILEALNKMGMNKY